MLILTLSIKRRVADILNNMVIVKWVIDAISLMAMKNSAHLMMYVYILSYLCIISAY
jgi:hypothetical protein